MEPISVRCMDKCSAGLPQDRFGSYASLAKAPTTEQPGAADRPADLSVLLNQEDGDAASSGDAGGGCPYRSAAYNNDIEAFAGHPTQV